MEEREEGSGVTVTLTTHHSPLTTSSPFAPALDPSSNPTLLCTTAPAASPLPPARTAIWAAERNATTQRAGSNPASSRNQNARISSQCRGRAEEEKRGASAGATRRSAGGLPGSSRVSPCGSLHHQTPCLRGFPP
jgi:hypothetical protein